MKRAGEVSGWIVAQCRRSALDAHGFGAQIYAEADAGVISEEEAAMLVRSLLTAGLDTTIQGIAHSLAAFADFPDQWKVLREKPSLTRNAFEEAIRFASPVMTFFRTTTREVELGGIRLSEGQKVLLFLASANRDPRRWANPNDFAVERESAGPRRVRIGHPPVCWSDGRAPGSRSDDPGTPKTCGKHRAGRFAAVPLEQHPAHAGVPSPCACSWHDALWWLALEADGLPCG